MRLFKTYFLKKRPRIQQQHHLDVYLHNCLLMHLKSVINKLIQTVVGDCEKWAAIISRSVTPDHI